MTNPEEMDQSALADPEKTDESEIADSEGEELLLPQEVDTHPEPSRKLNLTVAGILAVGLLLAAGLLIAGAVLALTGHGPYSEVGLSIRDISRAIRALEPSGFFYLGLIVLLATPVSRVVVLATVFAWRKSWTFCALGLLVLVVLVLSVLLGLEV